jgi:hypothetical protein
MVSVGSAGKKDRAPVVRTGSGRRLTAWSVSLALTAVVTACYGTPDHERAEAVERVEARMAVARTAEVRAGARVVRPPARRRASATKPARKRAAIATSSGAFASSARTTRSALPGWLVLASKFAKPSKLVKSLQTAVRALRFARRTPSSVVGASVAPSRPTARKVSLAGTTTAPPIAMKTPIAPRSDRSVTSRAASALTATSTRAVAQASSVTGSPVSLGIARQVPFVAWMETQ